MIMSKIDPSASCYGEVVSLSKEISARMTEIGDKEWDYKFEERQGNVEIEKTHFKKKKKIPRGGNKEKKEKKRFFCCPFHSYSTKYDDGRRVSDASACPVRQMVVLGSKE